MRFLKTPLVVLCLLFVARIHAYEVASPTVKSEQTTYIGKYHSSDQQIEAFLGIPFAKPPVGKLRWQAPQPLTGLASEYVSDSYKPACYQDDYNIVWYQQVAALFGTQLKMDMPPVSEDCLYLNIWKPTQVTDKKRPVMVWIHGGSNKSGWSYEPNYRGHNLAKKGNVIVISIAYRLGVFGFLAHPDLSNQAVSTNFALFDQIAALNWIQDNIEYFGGDKTNVTIMGESAGGANVGYLMSSPLTKGLFKQAISQSGAFNMMAEHDLADGQKLGTELSKQFKQDVNGLRQLPSDQIWQMTKKVAPNYDYRALVDNHLFTKAPALSLKDNADVNLLIGSNEHEFYMYQSDEIENASLALEPSDPKLKKALLSKFNSFTDKRLAQDWLDTFLYMSCPAALMAQLVDDNNHQAWLYRFERIRKGGETIKAYHGGEIPYMFDSHDNWLPMTEQDIALTDYMVSAWSNFAHYGNPNGIKEPSIDWPQFKKHTQKIQSLTGKSMTNKFDEFELCQSLWSDYMR
jgi:para-nitrobenzyl esterase